MTINFTLPGWGIVLILLAIIWAGLLFWPSERNTGGMDFGMGAAVEGGIRLIIGLIVTLAIVVIWAIFK